MSAPGNVRRAAGPRDEWETPDDFFDVIMREFEIEQDVCATMDNAKVRHFFDGPCPGSPCSNCGLCFRWDDLTCWMNPPYSEVSTWCMKAVKESRDGALVVALLPNATSEHWFHEWVIEKAHEIRLIRGRLKFLPPEGVEASGNTGGSVLAIYRPGPAPLRGAQIYPWNWRRGQ